MKCVDWHPHKGLLASGSKDSQQPIILWDPKSGKKLATLWVDWIEQRVESSECLSSHAHKNTCMALKWNRHNSNWLISASRDHFCKLFDIRNLKEELQCFRGHKKEACSKLCLLVDRPTVERVIVCNDFLLFIVHMRIKLHPIKHTELTRTPLQRDCDCFLQINKRKLTDTCRRRREILKNNSQQVVRERRYKSSSTDRMTVLLVAIPDRSLSNRRSLAFHCLD